MAEAPVNSPQAMGKEASVGPIAGKTAPFGTDPKPIGPAIGLSIQDLAVDAGSVILQDSVRAGKFQVEAKLVSSYVAATASYQLWGAKVLMPYLKNIDPSIRYDMGKVLYDAALLPALARVFGGRISLTDSILTSAGSAFFARGLNILINK